MAPVGDPGVKIGHAGGSGAVLLGRPRLVAASEHVRHARQEDEPLSNVERSDHAEGDLRVRDVPQVDRARGSVVARKRDRAVRRHGEVAGHRSDVPRPVRPARGPVVGVAGARVRDELARGVPGLCRRETDREEPEARREAHARVGHDTGREVVGTQAHDVGHWEERGRGLGRVGPKMGFRVVESEGGDEGTALVHGPGGRQVGGGDNGFVDVVRLVAIVHWGAAAGIAVTHLEQGTHGPIGA